MSDQQTAVEATSTPAVQPPVAPPAAPVATPPVAAAPAPVAPPAEPEKPRVKTTDLPDDALKKRLEDERRKGVEDAYRAIGKSESEIKALVAAEQKRLDEQKTLEQRLADREAALVAKQSEADAYLETIKQRAELELGLLTESQKAAVMRIAGDKPAEQLKTIDALWPTWKQETQKTPTESSGATTESGTGAPEAAPPVAPKPLGTAGAPSAPGEGTPAGTTDHRAKYEELLKVNPFAAAAYGEKYAREVYRPQTT